MLNIQGDAVVSTFEEPDLGDIDALNYIGFSAGLQYPFSAGPLTLIRPCTLRAEARSPPSRAPRLDPLMTNQG